MDFKTAISLSAKATGMLIPPVTLLTVVIKMVNTVLSHRLQTPKETKLTSADVKSFLSMVIFEVAALPRKRAKSVTKDAPKKNAIHKRI